MKHVISNNDRLYELRKIQIVWPLQSPACLQNILDAVNECIIVIIKYSITVIAFLAF